MISDKDKQVKDEFRKKYYEMEKYLTYIPFKKIIKDIGVSWGAWYRFIYYGANSLSLKKVKEIDEGIKKELEKMKAEIIVLLEKL